MVFVLGKISVEFNDFNWAWGGGGGLREDGGLVFRGVNVHD